MEQKELKQDKGGELTEKPKEGEVEINTAETDKKPEIVKVEREEQERTRIKKKLFLETFEKTMGAIKQTCEKIDINRDTYYNWLRDDPEFVKAISGTEVKVLDDAEGILMALVRKGIPRAVTYFLDRRHQKYKPRSVTEVVTGVRTLEDILDEEENKLKEKKNADGIITKSKDTVGGVAENKGQEGGPGTVQIQQSPAVLLGKENEEKHNTESQTERNK